MSRDTELYWLHGWWPYNPDDLATRKGGLGIYDKMRHDDTIKACLSFKKYAVLSSGWYVESPKGVEENDPITEFVGWSLKNMEGSLDDDLLEIMTAFDYGFSCTEKVFQILDDKTPYSGKVGLRALKTRKPHGVDFDWDEYGNLKPDGIIQGRHLHLPREKFIIYSHNKTFDNMYGESDLRACYRSWWSKDNIIKFWNIWLERYGMPPAVGSVTEAISPSDRIRLEDIIKNLTVKTGILLPKGVELAFPGVSGQGAMAYKEAVKAHDMAIARALLVPSLLGVSQQGDTGSYSQSQTHFNVFLWIVEKLRRGHEELLYEHLIKELVDYNFKVDAYPRFKFVPLDEEKKAKMAELFIQATEKGIIAPELQDENQLRRTLGWPEREESELDLAKKKRALGVVKSGGIGKEKEGQEGEAAANGGGEEIEEGQEEIGEKRLERKDYGGPDSGFRGHAGRPGLVGGSGTGGESDSSKKSSVEMKLGLSGFNNNSWAQENYRGIKKTCFDNKGDRKAAERNAEDIESTLGKIPPKYVEGLNALYVTGGGGFLGSAIYIGPSTKKGYASDQILLMDGWLNKNSRERQLALAHEIGHRVQMISGKEHFKEFKKQELGKYFNELIDAKYAKNYQKGQRDGESFGESFARHVMNEPQPQILKDFWENRI